MTTISADQIDFSQATPVVSNAQKLIIKIPSFAGEPLVYPKGAPKAGEPITDWEGKPIEGQGVVFFNKKDKSYQAVKSDGTGVIIINQVDPASAAIFVRSINKIADNGGLTLSDIKSFLSKLSMAGFGDQYNSDENFVAKKMTSAGPSGSAAGLFKRDDRDICMAVALSGSGSFQGPAASEQKFTDGAILIKQGDDVRLVQPDIFLQTYMSPDGKNCGMRISSRPTFRITT